MTRTIKQVISDIESNKLTIFDFDGFNSEKHEKLIDELCFLIEKKFGSRYLSESAREKKASKSLPDLKCYYVLKYGMERNETMEEMYNIDEHIKMVMPSKEELQKRRKIVLELLGI